MSESPSAASVRQLVDTAAVIEIFERARALARAGELDKADALCREAAEPTALLHFALGEIAAERGDVAGALLYLGTATALAPSNIAFKLSYGESLVRAGRMREAAEIAESAVAAAPDLGMAHALMGAVFFALRRLPDAIASYGRATEIDPNLAPAWNGLGQSLGLSGRPFAARDALQRAVELQPEDAPSWSALVAALGAAHRFDDARRVAEQALQRFPQADGIRANALFVMNADPERTAREIFTEHESWGAALAEREASKRRPWANARVAERPVRIGYLSADFRTHSVAFFMAPLIGAHDREQFEIFCYFNSSAADRTTEFFRARSTGWRDVAALSDDMLAELIRRDEIDILVDLTGYTDGCRMAVLAQKPAPVQVSYLGYPNTTGLRTVDYRISDALADPAGASEALHTEEFVRPFQSFLCYSPPGDAPRVADPPADGAGAITFGSFNDFRKINPPLVALWSAVMRAVPGSRMVVKTRPLAEPRCREHLLCLFRENGISEDRIDPLPADPGGTQHLARYGTVDIALDTFPYHGTTTTCEALWMGVPVITLAGSSHRSRVGVSLLVNAGLPDLVATTPDDFVNRTVMLAADAGLRRRLRGGIREMMQRSPLMDSVGFTRAIEQSYRDMWKRWCAQHSP